MMGNTWSRKETNSTSIFGINHMKEAEEDTISNKYIFVVLLGSVEFTHVHLQQQPVKQTTETRHERDFLLICYIGITH